MDFIFSKANLPEWLAKDCEKLNFHQRLDPPESLEAPYLSYKEEKLQLINPIYPKQKPVIVDFLNGPLQKRLGRVAHSNEVLKKAYGKKLRGKYLFDATAGLGVDSMISLKLGLNVVACEENPIVYLLLLDGLNRYFIKKPEEKESYHLYFGDSLAKYRTLGDRSFDLVYIDLMFDEQDKKSKSKKGMESLKTLMEEKSTENTLAMDQWFLEFLAEPWSRLIFKKPKKSALVTHSKFSHSLSLNSIRFDIYQ